MSQDSKRDSIIQAAKKRFSHFGVGKTTMNEIADDLSISKASLYYYFPDKLNLYAAVLQEIIETDGIKVESFIEEPSTETAILLYLDSKNQFVNKYYNILEHLQNHNIKTAKELQSIFSLVRTRQLATISGILDKGKASGNLTVADSKKTAELLLDSLEGLQNIMLAQHNAFFPDKKVFQAVLKREKELASIFIRGLRS